MISVQEAKLRILREAEPVSELEKIGIESSLDRILGVDVTAPFDVPPMDNTAVDGFAVRQTDLSRERATKLKVIADIVAGDYLDGEIKRGEAVRIMTGAPIPKGADFVLMQEHVRHEGDTITVPANYPDISNLRSRAEDVKQGDRVLEKGSRIRPQEMGILSSLGYTEIEVYRKPRIAVFSTGDEIVAPGEKRKVGQIYDSNRLSIIGLLAKTGAEPLDLGIIPDVKSELHDGLLEGSKIADMLITSGGVSVGVHDLVKQVLVKLGDIDFWQVKMKPGRPQAFGRIGGKLFFGLPGNPVSSMIVFIHFIRAAIWKMGGRKDLGSIGLNAAAKQKIRKVKGRVEFIRGIMKFENGKWTVSTTGPQGSGILSSMVSANCTIILDEDRGEVIEGEKVWVQPFDF